MPRLSLRAKLLGGVLLLYSFEAGYGRERALVLDDLAQTARGVALLLDTSFRDALTLAGVLAEDPAVRSLDPNLATATLQRVHRHYPALENLEVVDAAGDEVGASARPPGAPPRNRAAERHFQQAMATGAPVLSGVLVSPETGRPIVVAAAPITDTLGRRIGAVIVSLRAASANVGAALVALQLGALEDRLETAILAPGQAIFVADPGGTLAFHTALPDERWQARDVSDWPGMGEALAGRAVRTTDFRSPLTGDIRAAALVPASEFGWVVGMTWSADEAFGPREVARRQQLLIFGAIALLAVAGALALATYLARPIARLAAEARALGRGDLGRRVAIRTGDELETLGEAFNRMAAGLEAALQRLEQAVRVRDEFLASASHELRTPLSHITGFVGTLQRTDVAWDEATRRDFLAEIEREADRLARLIGDLLDLSRLESGGLAPGERAPARVADLVEGGLGRVRGLIGGQAVQADLPADLPPVLADAPQLERVVANLVENAAKYASTGTPIRVSGAVTAGEVELRVEDHGPGIPPEHLERVFERFFRVRPGGSPGAGLGLAIARGIVEAHGGRIWAENRPEGGARFVVRLPLAPTAPEERR